MAEADTSQSDKPVINGRSCLVFLEISSEKPVKLSTKTRFEVNGSVGGQQYRKGFHCSFLIIGETDEKIVV